MFCDRISSSLWNCKIKIQIINRCLNTPSIFYLSLDCAYIVPILIVFLLFFFFSSFFNFLLCFSLTSHLLVYDATVFLFSFSLFFFLLLSFSDTNDISSLSHCVILWIAKKKKKIPSRDRVPFIGSTDLIDENEERRNARIADLIRCTR